MSQPIIQEDDYGARLNESGWAVIAKTPGKPLLFAISALGSFYDLSESGPQLYDSSEGRRHPQHRVPVTALGLMLRPEGRVPHFLHHPTPLNAPGIPRRSPIKVLTRSNHAKLPRSDETGRVHSGKSV